MRRDLRGQSLGMCIFGRSTESSVNYPSIFLSLHMCIYICVYLSIYQSIFLSIYLSINQSIYLSYLSHVSLYIYIYIYYFISSSLFLHKIFIYTYIYIHIYMYLHIYISIRKTVYVSVCPATNLFTIFLCESERVCQFIYFIGEVTIININIMRLHYTLMFYTYC